MAEGKTVITLNGLKALTEATSSGKRIKPAYFKVSDADVGEIYPGIDINDLPSVWLKANISGYAPVNDNTVQFLIDIPAQKAIKFGRVFGLYLEDGTLFAVAVPPYPFPPLMRQRFKVQFVWEQIEAVMNFEDVPSFEWDHNILSWESALYASEFVRQELSTGIVSQPYGFRDPSRPMEENRIATVGWSAIGLHNHPNYPNMPGLGWFVANANGFLFQTRHNDYRTFKKKAGFLEVEENPAPQSPSLSIDGMKDLFRRYLEGELSEDEKRLFRWDLAYLEAFFIEIDSVLNDINDLYLSFRHALGTKSVLEVAKTIWRERLTGKQSRFQNSALLPFIAKENGKYVVLLYRILTQPLPQFSGLLWSDIIEPYEDYEIEKLSFFSAKKRFKWKKGIDLDSVWQTIPGLDGEGAQILSLESTDKNKISGGVNYAYYHRKFFFERPDAVNLVSSYTGWNDVNLIVAHTNNSQVYQGVSYLIPLELILRTPLESWNPYGLQEVSTLQGSGTESDPYNGISRYGRWFFTPAEFFTGKLEGITVADTSTSAKYVRDPSGTARLVYPSGIWNVLPEIDGIGKIRIRYPIYWDAHETGILGHFLSIQRKITESMLTDLSATLGEQLLKTTLLAGLKGG